MGRDKRGVRASSDSSIEITFSYRGERCRERIGLKPTPANLRAAERHKAAIDDAIAKGTFNYALTFPESKKAEKFVERRGEILYVEEYLEDWLERQKQHLKASTYNVYRKDVKFRFIKTWGTMRLINLRRPDIRAWCDTQKCSNKRLANMLSILRIALRDAMDDELIESNPLYGWSYKRKEAVKRIDDIDPFDAQEQAAILAQLKGQNRNLFQFAFWTGLRTSELVALEWGDIDWLRSVVRVTRAQTEDADEPETTKTSAGKRDVKLLPPALQALIDQKEHSLFHQSGRIFLNPKTLAPWTGDQQIRKGPWTPALRRAGIRYRRPYQTRHTYASMMLSAGEVPMWVAQQMGHADWTMIARVYGRWIPDANPTAGQKALEIFCQMPAFRQHIA